MYPLLEYAFRRLSVRSLDGTYPVVASSAEWTAIIGIKSLAHILSQGYHVVHVVYRHQYLAVLAPWVTTYWIPFLKQSGKRLPRRTRPEFLDSA